MSLADFPEIFEGQVAGHPPRIVTKLMFPVIFPSNQSVEIHILLMFVNENSTFFWSGQMPNFLVPFGIRQHAALDPSSESSDAEALLLALQCKIWSLFFVQALLSVNGGSDSERFGYCIYRKICYMDVGQNGRPRGPQMWMSSLVLNIQLLGYLILTHTHIAMRIYPFLNDLWWFAY